MEKTDGEINAAVAAACGWTEIETEDFSEFGVPCFLDTGKDPVSGQRLTLPDYCQDLNAAHEAEACVGARWATYCNTLLEIVEPEPRSLEVCHYWNLLHATARQRAEAFLRTLGKW